MNFSRSSEIELVIHNVTEHHDGIYKCIAENIAGNSESSTNVTVMCNYESYILIYFLVLLLKLILIYSVIIFSRKTQVKKIYVNLN